MSQPLWQGFALLTEPVRCPFAAEQSLPTPPAPARGAGPQQTQGLPAAWLSAWEEEEVVMPVLQI